MGTALGCGTEEQMPRDKKGREGYMVRLKPEIHNKAMSVAKGVGSTLSDLIEELLSDYLEAHPDA